MRTIRLARLRMKSIAVVAFSSFLISIPASTQEINNGSTTFLGCGTVQASPKDTTCARLSFQGEAANGKSFEKAIGSGLQFRLNPSGGGWMIEMVPERTEEIRYDDYIMIVTPPYHFGNPRYLDTGYGVSPRDSVHYSPREFNFVLDDKQFKKASHLVGLAVFSHPLSDTKSQKELEKESLDAGAALMRFPVAKGRLWILDSRIKDSAGSEDTGSIEWIKFKVELQVPCDFHFVQHDRDISVDKLACGKRPGKFAN